MFQLTTLTSYVVLTKEATARRRSSALQRNFLDGLVRLITKKSFPHLFTEIKRYFKGEGVIKKLITDVTIWKSVRIKRILQNVHDKVDAVESILWLVFQTRSKPKGRPEWEWLNSDYEVTVKRRSRKPKNEGGGADYGGGGGNYGGGGGEW